MVYSTLSVSAAEQSKLPEPYAISSGTSMATPYVAGYVPFGSCLLYTFDSCRILALFLASIGNPAPYTVYGYAEDSRCRPNVSLTKNILQSNAKAVRMYNAPFLATVAQQGAGLANALNILTATTIFSPSELALNDTVRRAPSYKVNITNIGTSRGVYKITHGGAALATGAATDGGPQLTQPLYTADYAVSVLQDDVSANPSLFTPYRM